MANAALKRATAPLGLRPEPGPVSASRRVSAFAIEVQHSSDRQRDGIWHEIETTDDLAYAAERGLVFEDAYGPRPVRIFDHAAGLALTVAQAFRRLRAAAQNHQGEQR